MITPAYSCATLACLLVVSINVPASLAQVSPTQTVAFPPTQAVGDKRVLTCLSLMETGLTASRDATLVNGIEGKVSPGQNGATLSIRSDSTLEFMSDAGAKVGGGAATFRTVRNDAAQLVAYFFDGQSMSSLVLNKDNGLAIWSKIRSTFPVYDAPTGSSSFMVCS
jgi:hypothetical protein